MVNLSWDIAGEGVPVACVKLALTLARSAINISTINSEGKTRREQSYGTVIASGEKFAKRHDFD